MNKTLKKTLSIILTALMLVTTVPFAFAAGGDTVILYTNDIHCAVEDYPVLAAYRAELISQGNKVITVDAGDAIPGDAYSNGDSIVEIMNAVGYDYAVPGEGEFEYGRENFFNLAENKAEFKYISSNLHYLPSVSPVFEPYVIKDFGDYRIAFIGISTPETATELPDDCFKDKGGNYIYGFPVYRGGMTNEDLYDNVQKSIDCAIDDGADIVVAVGHLGIEGVTEGWKSTDVIAGTTGIDYFIDAHSHEVTETEAYTNKDGETVTLTSGGKNFEYFGRITLKADGSVEFELINPDTVNIEGFGESARSEYSKVKALVDNYYAEAEAYYKEVDDAVADLENVIADLDKKITELSFNGEIKVEIEVLKAEIEALKANITITKEDVEELLERVNAITAVVDKCINGSHTFTDSVRCNACGTECEHSWVFDTCTVCKYVCSTHFFTKYEEVEAPTCTEAGFESATCYYGCGVTHEREIPVSDHFDEDGDGLCDYGCGTQISSGVEGEPGSSADDCDHLCHKTGFMGFIWKIVRVILKLFRMNPVCECGMAHY